MRAQAALGVPAADADSVLHKCHAAAAAAVASTAPARAHVAAVGAAPGAGISVALPPQQLHLQQVQLAAPETVPSFCSALGNAVDAPGRVHEPLDLRNTTESSLLAESCGGSTTLSAAGLLSPLVSHVVPVTPSGVILTASSPAALGTGSQLMPLLRVSPSLAPAFDAVASPPRGVAGGVPALDAGGAVVFSTARAASPKLVRGASSGRLVPAPIVASQPESADAACGDSATRFAAMVDAGPAVATTGGS